ncbi:hypothetical protein GUITHDRAFT_99380 [Guillardia theta CCMP2712]|uniref:HTH myb-type domain-containing protein n=1 Tax=Guillardia theta (strain CCMP2712) TaxID=905079 RepID=L1K2B6_GUITC|nr:hypothetical protein GUITHDRAFT_99380 [Guillardia theta CCMP2712]EKX54724.1 hypothetical protein GUITHDRAFT_99380 [Guillardia theta CCMP2712]|eukprot:XP_005841704.1 hypothetical protein GUITHDRAFT_99380 [Guillardia theta CCMP2712]
MNEPVDYGEEEANVRCIDLTSLKPGDIFYDHFWHERFFVIPEQTEEPQAFQNDRLHCSVPSKVATEADKTTSMSSATSPSSPSIHSKNPMANDRPKHWSEEEHRLFLKGLELFCQFKSVPYNEDGTLFVGLGTGVAEKIAKLVRTRSPLQVRSHAQKYFQKLIRNMKRDAKKLGK